MKCFATIFFVIFSIFISTLSFCATIQKNAYFDTISSEQQIVVQAIDISGNRITKESYILRELSFRVGDTLLLSELSNNIDQSKSNLINTSLFLNSTLNISYRFTDTNQIKIEIKLTERWYLWPEPILENAERNFNTWWLNKDFSKLNYGIQLIRENFRGRNERLSLVLRFGFDKKYELTYERPAINPDKTLGIGIGAGYVGNHVVAVKSFENKPYYIQSDNYLRQQIYSYFEIIFRPDIHSWHYFRLNIKRFIFADTLLANNPNYSFEDDLSPSSFGFKYFLKIDHRDAKAYPLTGSYFDVELNQYGLGLFNSNSNRSIGCFKTNLRKYFRLTDRLYYAAGVIGKATTNIKLPEFLEKGLGYGREFVRGYEYYIMDAAHFFVMKQNFKFALLPQRNIPVHFKGLKKVHFLRNLPYKKFEPFFLAMYINLFFDYGITKGTNLNNNNLTNRDLYGWGLGLDFVTYYDKVLRVEASMNHLKETGIYIHFIAPI